MATQLQYYRHDYAKVCMTGLLGCRWHRYKQSTKGSRKRDVAWFVVCLLVSLYVLFWLYYWLIAANDRLSLNAQMYRWTRSRVNWFLSALILFSVLFVYVILLMLLSVCHIIQGHQLYTHPVHLAIVMFILTVCIAFTVVTEELWEEEWSVIFLSLQVFGPFLQIGAVAFMTVLSWIIANKWFKITKLEYKLGGTGLYCFLMLSLYISPLFINSPCVILQHNLPTKPKIFAHRGASAVAPENTVISFEIAAQYDVYGIETDVQISAEGELFIMHDSTLHRTTNVAEIYPDMVDQDASEFNMTQLSQLSAGDWFVKTDPAGTVDSLSETERSLYSKQTIPTFLKILQLCQSHNMAVMLDFRIPQTSHPYYNDTYHILTDIAVMSGINKSKLYWPTQSYNDFKPPDEWTTLYIFEASAFDLRQNNYSGVHFGHEHVDSESWKMYRRNNLTTSVYMVNKSWLYSFYWCIGTEIVTTDYCDVITKIDSPIWHLPPDSYLIMWVLVDCVSALTIIIMFYIQRYRLLNNRYHPERMSLNNHSNGSSSWGPKRSRRSMKEKLLMKDVQADTYDFEPDDDFGIDSNGYNVTVTASEGRELSQAFHSNRTSYHSNTTADTEDDELTQTFHSSRNSFHGNDGEDNRLRLHGDGGESNRSSFISSVENGDLFGARRNSYHAMDNNPLGGEHTNIFPNRTGDHTLGSGSNTYQSETTFT